MKRLFFGAFLFSVLFFVSCQKEIDWGLASNSFGDLLIKAVQVTPSTNDTNTITLQWNASRRLVSYKSAGKVNGAATDILYTISRQADGKITKIVSSSSLTAGFLDSTVYFPFYQAGGSALSYVIDSQYTIIGTIMDSITYSYNGTQIISKETFSDLFGSLVPTGKQVYTYDANGNITVVTDSIPNGSGYDLGSTTTYTYDSHRSMITLGEETFIVLDPVNVCKNNFTKQIVTDATGGNSSTTTGSQFQFNAVDRPIKFTLSVTPQPPGYDTKLTLFYQ
jgi:YD repeat-containing protein